MTRFACLASGSGTILASIIKYQIPLKVVIADKPCPALMIAADAGIPTTIISRNHYGYRAGIGEAWDRAGFTKIVAQTLLDFKIDVAAMAGFFTILDPIIFELFTGFVLNIHPALLPNFKGEHAVRDALAAGVKETGSTVHIATELLDDERFIVDQVRVPVEEGDTVETLWERIKVEERQFYPRVLQKIQTSQINLRTIQEGS